MLVLGAKVVVAICVELAALEVAVPVVSARLVAVMVAVVVADWPPQLQPIASEPHHNESALQWLSVVPQLPHFERQCAAVCQALLHGCPAQLPPPCEVDMVVLGANVVVMAMVDELVAGMVVAGLVVVPVATADITALQSTC